ncbi:MAG: hypothetical protein ACYDHZ_01040 [Dehalococcoidia bacterium]|jgi:hypothetical protein
MESKYLKIAVILGLASFLLISVVFGIIVLMVRGPSFLGHPSNTTACTQEAASSLAANLIKSSSTFAFDGIGGSIKQVSADSTDNGQTWKLLYTFAGAHPGYGDRKGQMLAEVITGHSVQLTLTNCKIVSAICDNSWDLLSDKTIQHN